ncbi:MAG: hypothetical protein ACXAEU_00005, partial [Candidatus Hodarchaeales archaeon]
TDYVYNRKKVFRTKMQRESCVLTIDTNKAFFAVDWLGGSRKRSASILIKPLVEVAKNQVVITDQVHGTTINNINFSAAVRRVNEERNNSEIHEIIGKLSLIERIKRINKELEGLNSKEVQFTYEFFEELICRREGKKSLAEALLEGNIELLQINYNDGIGDITYINHQRKLVVIEIKRTSEAFITPEGGVISHSKNVIHKEISEDIVKLSFIAAGREFWDAILGLKGGGLFYDKNPLYLKKPLVEALNRINKLEIESEVMFVTFFRKLSFNVTKKRMSKVSYQIVPITGFFVNRVDMNEFIEKGKKICWKYDVGAKKGDSIEIDKGNAKHIGLAYANVITRFLDRIVDKRKIRISTMVLYDLFGHLKKKKKMKTNGRKRVVYF